MEDTKNPWPLAITTRIEDSSLERVKTDDKYSMEGVFGAQVEILKYRALQMMRRAGRLPDVRALQLVCYDHDITNQPIEEKE